MLLEILLKKTSVDVDKNFVGVFSFQWCYKIYNFSQYDDSKHLRYPFIIINTDCNDKKGAHWWRFFNLHPKNETFTFDSFGFERFKEFLLQGNKKALNNILYRIKKNEKKIRG